MSTTSLTLDIAGFSAAIISAIIYLRAGTRKVNDSAATELIKNLTRLRETDKEEFNSRLKCLEEQHVEDAKLLAHMQGQIAAYRDIPLQDLSVSMQAMAADIKVSTQAQAEILKTLKGSALIAAEDRAFLSTPKNQNVEMQTVEHQTVRGSKK